jgi:acyl transferase domain-containing protein/NAD(P)H-dependent flavin oxidoreductase YrpB (nitropropane dioxygenase family)/NADP-dependent 3-hydroxy acid dehydrogenase YdfG
LNASNTFPTIVGITPFERPDARLAVALSRGGALGVLDLGRDLPRGLAAARAAAGRVQGGPRGGQQGGLGVRIHEGAVPDRGELPRAVEAVVLPPGAALAPWIGLTRFVQATTLEEAVAAQENGAEAVIVVGHEAGGRHGTQGTFVLLQAALARLEVPIWAQGGVGLYSAAACVAGGAAGVVLDSQLALVRESASGADVRRAVESMDGTETVTVGGYRVFDRPDLRVRERFGDATPEEISARLGGDDLATQLLPVGQDGAMARELAERFGTAGGVVEAVRRSIREGIRLARQDRPLAPGAPLARELGTEFPILQGPMTRVSDEAAFALAVAEAGGLPFLALSVITGERLAALLDQTREALGDLPWGVGVLGFVPPELRAEQLRAIEEAKPPFALIAGGRPSQARGLEKLGIRTFLHVPSDGLLDLFLKEGATAFVFEGRECGGHVGPLSSLVLWDRQLRRLMEHDRPEELSVVFAGGIHDGRSAAMIAALAAPLAARGARVGVLMGTAYLFTEEAVSSGAIVPGYQEAVRECHETVLLETSPGHSTRCARSAYWETFTAERAKLDLEGVDAKERWARLEQLNLGRLRMASKGLRREGDELVEIDTDAQRAEGMYMVGDVATLRDGVTTIAELHRDVSEGSTGALADARVEVVDERRPAEPLDVAIVGMACVFPGARDLDEYWYNILHGVDSIREVNPERWNPEIYFDPEGRPGHTTPSKWGGFIDPIPFDPARYGIPPRSLIAIDPIQLLSLEVAQRALEDAGYGERDFDRERTGVIFGAEGGTDLSKAYGFRALYPQYVGQLPEVLQDSLPSPTEDSFPGVLTNVIAGRIANRLDLGGENYTLNAACASSLASLSVAANWLRQGSADMVLVGGADVHNSVGDFLMFASVHALSRTGRCRTFDQEADGISLGEGVGVVVVRRLADAVRDGDRIYAVLSGVGGSSDGKSLGLTAPRPEGQVRAYARAYEEAGLSPADVGLLEAHGTGTVVGDRTELVTMDRLFTAAGAPPGTCALGSVKSQIGHTKGAAGIASVIKTSLALHHRVLPPTINVTRPNAYFDAGTSPFTLSDRSRPWLADRRVAGVSAFGFGGTNYHVVLEEHVPDERPAVTHVRWAAELFLFRGQDRDAALERMAKVGSLLDAAPPWDLRDLARSASAGDEPVWLAIVARDAQDLREKMALARDGREDADGVFQRTALADEPGRLAFLFPGQGSQYPGMLDELFVAFPALHDLLDLDRDVARVLHPPRAFTPAEGTAQRERLKATDVAQVALGMADLAMGRLLGALGIRPDMVAGHSYGEMVALAHAGVWSDADLLDLSRIRARAILDAAGDDPGGMVAAQGGPEEIAPLVESLDGIVLANQNAPDQTILSGPTAQVEEATRLLEAASVKATRLPVACAFHSGVVAGARGAFLEALEATETHPPTTQVWSNVTAAPYPEDAGALRRLMADQLPNPVLFGQELVAMYEAGARVFVEVGPGRVLTNLVERNLADRPHVAVNLDVNGEPALERFLGGLARLAANGVVFDAEVLYRDRDARVIDLDDPPVRAYPPLAWWVDGHYARPVHGELPEGALKPVLEPPARGLVPMTAFGGIGLGGGGLGRGGGGDGEAVVVEYLRNIRELAEAQRQVVLGYLGATEAARPAPGREIVMPAREAVPPVAAPAGPAPGVREQPQDEVPLAEIPLAEIPLAEMLLLLVSERTGYPPEMLDIDLDLEADLSIDSIKRIEILGVLNERVGLADHLGDDRDELLEELSSLKTLRGIQEWIETRTGLGAEAGTGSAGDGSSRHVQGTRETSDEASGDGPVERFRLELRPAPLPSRNGVDLEGATFAITDDGRGVARALQALLTERGANPRIVSGDDDPGAVDGLIHLAPLAAGNGPDGVKVLFTLAKAVSERPAHWLIGVTGLGGRLGHGGNGNGAWGGIAGLVRSLAKEWTDGVLRTVDVDASEAPESVARHILAELTNGEGPLEVGYAGGERRATEVIAAPLEKKSSATLALDSESVVLITGGARGITSLTSVELARLFGCRLVLVGRTPAPEGEESGATSAISDPIALRRRLVELNPSSGAVEVEGMARRLLASREIRTTLRRIEEAGGSATYHAVDARDGEAFAALIEGLYEEYGRLDGVIHGAGLIEDKLLAQKSRESFDEVFDTKVSPALTLARTLRDDTLFVVFFSSVAGVYGNRGQTDYAAANDFLDKLARQLNERIRGRVVSVAWGPWDGTGMVTPELRREYRRRGIGLIPPAEGVRSLMEELALGPVGEANVVIMSGTGLERR